MPRYYIDYRYNELHEVAEIEAETATQAVIKLLQEMPKILAQSDIQKLRRFPELELQYLELEIDNEDTADTTETLHRDNYVKFGHARNVQEMFKQIRFGRQDTI